MCWQNAHPVSVQVPCINRDQISIFQSIHLVLVLHLFVLRLFALMPLASLLCLLIGWLHTWTQLREYESHGAEQTCETAPSLQTTSTTMCSSFSSGYVAHLHLFKPFCIILPTNAMITHPVMDPPHSKKLT